MEYNDYKFAFDGCGNTNGILGSLFGYGLKDQSQKVANAVFYFIKMGFKVRLNCLGLSRGGVAILLLVKLLSKIPNTQLEMNIVLFDPVPGNLISSAKLDFIKNTLTNQSMDISDSLNLRRVLAIYPYLPLPDFLLHAPIIPIYPSHSLIEEDVALGCHQGALFYPNSLDSRLSFIRIKSFMEECGSPVSESIKYMYSISEQDCLNQMEAECNNTPPNSIRYTHSRENVVILRGDDGEYLNWHHYYLKKKMGLPVSEKPTFKLRFDKGNGS